MHITPQWQDASGGFRYVIIVTADHLQHVSDDGIEARMRQAPARPATSDPGDALFVKSQSQQITLADTTQRLWLKSLVTQFDAVIGLSTFNTITAGDPVTSYQMRRALSEQGFLDDVYAGVGDLDAPPRIQWDSAGIVTPGDDLALNIQATLAYTDGQMRTLFELARTFPTKAGHGSTFVTLAAGDPVTAYQMRRALSDKGLLDDVYAGVGDLDALSRIQWDSAGMVAPGDDLALNIQATLAYTDDQMRTLFAIANIFPTKAWV